jgi:hypothetical protein
MIDDKPCCSSLPNGFRSIGHLSSLSFTRSHCEMQWRWKQCVHFPITTKMLFMHGRGGKQSVLHRVRRDSSFTMTFWMQQHLHRAHWSPGILHCGQLASNGKWQIPQFPVGSLISQRQTPAACHLIISYAVGK